jgi:hypothetical protein
MAKGSKPGQKSAQPYLGGAFICERLLTETDNVSSAIRIVDTVTLPPLVPPPKRGAGVGLPMALIVFFRCGDARGEREVRIRQIGPSGKRKNFARAAFNLEGPPEGAATIFLQGVPVKWDGEGLYWFEVLLGGVPITRIPLRIKIAQPAAAAPSD